MALKLSRVSRLRSKTNCVIDVFRTRQFTSRKLLAGAWSEDCTVSPIGPPEVKTAIRRLGGPPINRWIAPQTRLRNAGQDSTPLALTVPSSHLDIAAAKKR